MKHKIALTLDDDVIERLKVIARQDNRSVSNFVEHQLKRKIIPTFEQQKEVKKPLD